MPDDRRQRQWRRPSALAARLMPGGQTAGIFTACASPVRIEASMHSTSTAEQIPSRAPMAGSVPVRMALTRSHKRGASDGFTVSVTSSPEAALGSVKVAVLKCSWRTAVPAPSKNSKNHFDRISLRPASVIRKVATEPLAKRSVAAQVSDHVRAAELASMGDLAAGGEDLHGVGVVHPAEQVEGVHADVVERPAADRRVPAPGRQVRGCLRALAVADERRSEALTDRAGRPGKAYGEVQLQPAPAGLARRLDAQAVGDTHGHRLLEEQVLTGFEGGHGEVCVGVVGRGDGEDVDLRVLEQAGRVGRVHGAVVLGGESLRSPRVDVAERAYGDIGIDGGMLRVRTASTSATD